MSARETSKADDPLEPPQARTKTHGRAPETSKGDDPLEPPQATHGRAPEMSKGDDPLEPPQARTKTHGRAPEKPDQDRVPEQDQTPEDETKRKFREALAAKQGRKGEDHIDNAQQHVHAQGPIGTKRTFRRKTG